MSKEIDTKIECCEIWNSLKDKTKMIDFLINAKTEIDQLKQENETLFLQLSKQEIDEHKPVYCTLAGNDCKYLGKIKELKQQLAEKDEEIELKEHVIQSIEKQRDKAYDDYGYLSKIERELALQNYDYEKQIALLKSSEKCLTERIKNQTQLAVAELEKLNTILYESHYKQIGNKYYATLEDIENVISQQIKLLKG